MTLRGMAYAAWLVVVLTAEAGQAPREFRVKGEKMSVEELDHRIATVKQAMWATPELLADTTPDGTGATAKSDMEEYVLSDEVLAEIEKLRAGAVAAAPARGSRPIPAAATEPVLRALARESCRAAVVADYWKVQGLRAFHHDITTTLIGKLRSPLDSAEFNAQLELAGMKFGSLRKGMVTDLEQCSGHATGPGEASTYRNGRPLLVELNGLRQQVASRLPSTDERFRSVLRTTPCQPAVRPGSAVRVVSAPDLRDFYPADALRYEVQGRVMVALTYGPDGCVRVATLLQSSGSGMLDKAAFEYAFGMVLQPSEVDGNAVAGQITVPISFTIKQ